MFKTLFTYGWPFLFSQTRVRNGSLNGITLFSYTVQTYTVQKMKFCVKEFFNKCKQSCNSKLGQTSKMEFLAKVVDSLHLRCWAKFWIANLVTFTKELLNGKLHFLPTVMECKRGLFCCRYDVWAITMSIISFKVIISYEIINKVFYKLEHFVTNFKRKY